MIYGRDLHPGAQIPSQFPSEQNICMILHKLFVKFQIHKTHSNNLRIFILHKLSSLQNNQKHKLTNSNKNNLVSQKTFFISMSTFLLTYKCLIKLSRFIKGPLLLLHLKFWNYCKKYWKKVLTKRDLKFFKSQINSFCNHCGSFLT